MVRLPASNFAATGPLAGYAATRTAAGGDRSVDSNGSQPTIAGADSASVTAPAAGSANHTIDFGVVRPRSIGNRLWFDTGPGGQRDNGVLVSGEKPVIGATVQLLNSSGKVIATTTTDSHGYYRFDGLSAADYKVRVAASNFTGSGPLAGYQSSTGSKSGNNRDHGIDVAHPSSTGVTSATIDLATDLPGGDLDAGATGAGRHGPTGDALDNLTIDFGFVQTAVTQPIGLANTGIPAATQTGLAVALIAAGCLLLLAARRRRQLPG